MILQSSLVRAIGKDGLTNPFLNLMGTIKKWSSFRNLADSLMVGCETGPWCGIILHAVMWDGRRLLLRQCHMDGSELFLEFLLEIGHDVNYPMLVACMALKLQSFFSGGCKHFSR